MFPEKYATDASGNFLLKKDIFSQTPNLHVILSSKLYNIAIEENKRLRSIIDDLQVQIELKEQDMKNMKEEFEIKIQSTYCI